MKLLSTLCGILLYTACFAQDKIEGIGPFKIGKMTTGDLQQLAKSEHSKIGVIDRDETPAYQFSEIVLNTKNPSKSHRRATYCPTGRVFYIESIKVAGVPLNQVYLTFSEDKLISLSLNPTDKLTEAIKFKYGEPDRDSETRKEVCDGVQYDAKTYWSRWRNESITAAYSVSEYRGLYCRPSMYESFSLYDERLTEPYNECANKSKPEVLQSIRDSDVKQKAKLKDF